MAEAIAALQRKPAIVGHSFGGLITQQLAGQGLGAASVAIDSAPFRGVLPLPLSALRSATPVIGNPANYRRAVMLSYEQFRYSFANAVSENEARRLYDAYPVPGSGIPLFQAATANVNPLTEIKVNTRNPARGPLLLITGEKDHIAPHAIAAASYRKQKRNRAATQIQEIPDRGHSLVFDSGWQDVAETALAFIKANR
jgi:non-heme chloroperoxidase